MFTPRKSAGKPFYVAADRRDAADKALRDATVTREAVRELETAVQQAQDHLATLNAEHGRSGGILASWLRILRVHKKLARLDSTANELIDLADLPAILPEQLQAWREALATDAALLRDVAKLDATDAAEAAEIAALAVDEKLLAEAAAIDALRERLGAVRDRIDHLPRRRQARDEAERQLNELARRLGLGAHDALLLRLPTDAALARARDVISQLTRALQALADAEARQIRAETEHRNLAADEGPAQAMLDVEQVRQRFDAIGDIPAQADRHRRDLAALNSDAEILALTVAALDPAPGTLDRLRALPLPDADAIAKFVHALESGANDVKRVSDGVAASDDAIAITEAELARLRSGGTVPSRSDLNDARQQRDAQLDALHAALDGDAALRARHFDEVAQSSKAIDGITDLLLTDTGRAARYDDALQRLAAHRANRDRDAGTLQKLQAGMADISTAWTDSWTTTGLVPRTPADMARWRGKVEDILIRLGKLDTHKVNLDALAASLDSGKAALVAFLTSVRRTPDAALAPDILYREAKARVDELQAAWADARAHAVKRERIERDLSDAAASLETAQAAVTALRALWPSAMSGIGLADGVSSAEAEAALAVWQSVALPKSDREKEAHRVETIEADLAAFDADVSDLAARVAPQLASDSAQETLARLLASLDEARTASQTSQRLRHSATQRTAARHALVVQRQAIAPLLDDACRIVGVGADMLPASLARLVTRHALESERVALQRDLHESEGRDENALRREGEGLDLDLLPSEIAREEVRQSQLLKDIADASALHHDRKTSLDALLKGRNAPAAATERAEAGAELLSVAERWLLRAAAAKLAARTIERHRAMVQDPLIASASSLFATATDSAFAGLVIAYGDDDQPELMAQRRDGEQVKVTGLSEGTRDQLFLALRLALLERRTSEPMPFIGDDLLASFDETRTLAMLRLLAAPAVQRQVILFTHHRHVADLARSIAEHPVDIIEL